LGVIDQSSFDGFFSIDIGVKAALIGRGLVWLNADYTSNNRPNTVGTNDQIVLCGRTISEINDAGL